MTRPRILVVEDVEHNRDLLVQLLEDEYAVATATDGAAGLAAALRDPPDAILLDLSLPAVDGWEVARRLKAHPHLRTVPVIALSAHAMAGDRQRALDSGCDDYLAKPLDEDQLFATLRAHLNRAAERSRT